MLQWVILYCAAINLLTAVIAVWDKRAAKRHQWRIPEKTLFALALLGGSLGLLFAMYTARHKTRKPAFFIGVPLILLAQAALVWWLIRHGIFV